MQIAPAAGGELVEEYACPKVSVAKPLVTEHLMAILKKCIVKFQLLDNYPTAFSHRSDKYLPEFLVEKPFTAGIAQ